MKFIHDRDYRNGATVAYKRTGAVIIGAVARVNSSDQFERKIGRQVAAGRLTKLFDKDVDAYDSAIGAYPYFQTEVSEDATGDDIYNAVVTASRALKTPQHQEPSFSDLFEVPSWVKLSAAGYP